MLVARVDLSFSCSCTLCGATLKGGTRNRMELRVYLHLLARHPKAFVLSLWEAWKAEG